MSQDELEKLEMAKAIAEVALQEAEKVWGAGHPELALFCANLGNAVYALGNTNEAHQLLRHAFELAVKHSETHYESFVLVANKCAVNLARIEEELDNVEEANKLREIANAIELVIQESLCGEDEIENDRITFYERAIAEQKDGNLEEAKLLIKASIECGETAGYDDVLDITVPYFRLAGIERDLGNLAEAKRLYEKIIATREQHGDEDSPYLANSYFNLASVEHETKNLTEAKKFYERAIEVNILGGGNDEKLSNCYCNFGSLEADLQNMEEARRLYEKSIELYEKHAAENLLSLDNPDLAMRYHWLGIAEENLGNFESAQRCYRRAIEIEENAFKVLLSDSIAEYYSSLGYVEYDLGNFVESKRCYQRTMEIVEKTTGFDAPDYSGGAHSGLAFAEAALGNLQAAQQLFRQAIEIGMKNLEPNDHRLALRHAHLGNVEQKLGNLDEAARLKRKAFFIYRSLPEKQEEAQRKLDWLKEHDANIDTFFLVENYTTLGDKEEHFRHFAEAQWLYARAVVLCEQYLGLDHPDLAPLYNKLGDTELYLGNAMAAQQYYQKAVEICEKHSSPHLAVCYYNLGYIESTKMNNMPEPSESRQSAERAKQYYERALEIADKLPPDSDDLADIYSALGKIERSFGNLAEAKQFYEKALKIEKERYSDLPTLSHLYYLLGGVESELGNYAASKILYDESQEIQERYFHTVHAYGYPWKATSSDFLFLAEKYFSLGTKEFEQGNMAEAVYLFRRAFLLFRQCGKPTEAQKVQDWLNENDPSVEAFLAELLD